MRAIVGLGLLLTGSVMVLPAQAVAADSCAVSYTRARLGAHVEAAREALRSSNDDELVEITAVIEDALPCLDSPLSKRLAPTLYRLLGAGRFLSGDTDGAVSWFRSAVAGEPTGSFGVDEVPSDDPLRAVYEKARSTVAEAERQEGKTLAVGTWYLDGREIDDVVGRRGHYHLLQLQGDVDVQSWIVRGGDYPDAALEGGKRGGSKSSDSKIRDKGPVEVARSRPKGKIPTLIIGSTLVAASGGLLAGNLITGQGFADADMTTAEQVDRAALTTNSLAVASGVAFAAGAGTIGWGIALNGGGPGATFHFRF